MSAVVGICVIKLGLDESRSLKDKRRCVISIKEKVRQKFRVAIAETDDLDKMKSAELTLCAVANDEALVNSQIDRVIEFVENLRTALIVDTKVEILHV